MDRSRLITRYRPPGGDPLFRELKPVPNLLTLPAEIRNYISELAVVYEEPIRPEFTSSCKEWWFTERNLNFYHLHAQQPGLAFVNRQMRKEVLPMYFAGNHFDLDTVVDGRRSPVHHPRWFWLWRKLLGDNARFLRQVIVRQVIWHNPKQWWVRNRVPAYILIQISLNSKGAVNVVGCNDMHKTHPLLRSKAFCVCALNACGLVTSAEKKDGNWLLAMMVVSWRLHIERDNIRCPHCRKIFLNYHSASLSI